MLPAARAVAELYRAGASSLMDATSAGVAAGSWARGIIAGVRSLTGAVLDGAAGGAGDAVVAAASDAVEDLVSGLAVQGLGNAAGSGLLYLPSGPVMLLGLAPLSLPGRGWTWWPSQQVWRVTEAVSLVVAVAGYGYCRADGERRGRLQPAAVQGNIAAVKRPADGL